MTSLPPAGWYPNPSGAPGQRYFDGRDWTAHHRATPQQPTAASLQPIPASLQPAPLPHPPQPIPMQTQRRGHRPQPRTARRAHAADLLGVRRLGVDMADRRLEQSPPGSRGDHAATAAQVNGSRLPTHGLARHPLQDPVGNRFEAVAEVEPLRVQVDDHIGFGRDGPVTAETGRTAAQRTCAAP